MTFLLPFRGNLVRILILFSHKCHSITLFCRAFCVIILFNIPQINRLSKSRYIWMPAITCSLMVFNNHILLGNFQEQKIFSSQNASFFFCDKYFTFFLNMLYLWTIFIIKYPGQMSLLKIFFTNINTIETWKN